MRQQDYQGTAPRITDTLVRRLVRFYLMETLLTTRPKSVHGASIGILMLETRFPRLPGDLGFAGTWDFPVHYRVVSGATASKAITEDPVQLLQPFIDTARELVAIGVDGITTSCGFLSPLQKQLSSAVGVPVAASSLMQVAWIDQLLPEGKRAGILTIDSSNLTSRHLHAAGAALDTPVAGTQKGQAFTRAILGDASAMDVDLCREDNIRAARELVVQHPEVAAIVLECTNMVPYAADIQASTGRPVYSIYNLITWFQSGLVSKRFTPDC